ncbi:hypothetical protein GOODEAATRI_018699 [Goodea atripinnis]|uniref:Uncharacterized protein n=1 Tax=Goodea atripinnis TaxID=208336 RepID=A0ABV0MT81_9TELE
MIDILLTKDGSCCERPPPLPVVSMVTDRHLDVRVGQARSVCRAEENQAVWITVGMYLLEQMERGTPQRKTVYRISLTLVKRESLDESKGEAEDPQVGAVRREDSMEQQRGGLLEQLKEVEESDDGGSHGFIRRFRTFSTGQLELGRLRVSRRLQKEDSGGKDPGRTETAAAKVKRLLKAKSMEERSPHSGPNRTASTPLKPSLLQRSFSFSFRNRISGELLRLRALSRDRHHSSSSCIAPPAAEPPTPRPQLPNREKSRTLEVGAVLNRTDSLTELSRRERARGTKNRTLDNSDLLRLAAEGEGAVGESLLRGGGGRSSERRLGRIFSGIFSRRDGTSSPAGSPSFGRSLRRSRRMTASQSSTESMNGGGADGNYTTHLLQLFQISSKLTICC